MIIAFLTIDSLSEGVGRSQIVSLVRKLRNEGLSVKVVSLEKKKDPNLLRQFIDEGIDWRVIEFGTPGEFGGLLRFLRLVFNIPKADVYHARSDLPALALVLRGKRPFIWDVRSFWLQQRAIINGNRFIDRILKVLWIIVEKIISKRASAINTLAEAAQNSLLLRLGSIPSERSVIPTSVDLEVFAFNPKFPRKRKILISGTWNNFYDWELTRRLVAFFNETGFVVSWCRPRESKTHQLFLPNVQIIETEYANMPQFIADSSFGIAICRDDVGVSLSAAVPTKIAEFLSVGRPVILSSGMGDLDKLISETNTGIILDRRTSLEGLLSSMNFLLQDKETPMRCRSLALRHFDLSEAARKYSALYKKIASTTS